MRWRCKWRCSPPAGSTSSPTICCPMAWSARAMSAMAAISAWRAQLRWPLGETGAGRGRAYAAAGAAGSRPSWWPAMIRACRWCRTCGSTRAGARLRHRRLAARALQVRVDFSGWSRLSFEQDLDRAPAAFGLSAGLRPARGAWKWQLNADQSAGFARRHLLVRQSVLGPQRTAAHAAPAAHAAAAAHAQLVMRPDRRSYWRSSRAGSGCRPARPSAVRSPAAGAARSCPGASARSRTGLGSTAASRAASSRVQARGRFVEEGLRGGFGAIHAAPELGDVQIDLEDAPLGPQRFDQHRVPGFQSLAHPAVAAPQEQVLGHLLRDGAGAARAAAAIGLVQRLLDLREIEAMVFEEALVFGGHHGQRQLRARSARSRAIRGAGARGGGRRRTRSATRASTMKALVQGSTQRSSSHRQHGQQHGAATTRLRVAQQTPPACRVCAPWSGYFAGFDAPGRVDHHVGDRHVVMALPCGRCVPWRCGRWCPGPRPPGRTPRSRSWPARCDRGSRCPRG